MIKGTTATLRCGAAHDPRVSLRSAPQVTASGCSHRALTGAPPQRRELLVVFWPRLTPVWATPASEASPGWRKRRRDRAWASPQCLRGQPAAEGFSLLRGGSVGGVGRAGPPAEQRARPRLSHVVRGQFVGRRGLGDADRHGMNCNPRRHGGSGRGRGGEDGTPQADARRLLPSQSGCGFHTQAWAGAGTAEQPCLRSGPAVGPRRPALWGSL